MGRKLENNIGVTIRLPRKLAEMYLHSHIPRHVFATRIAQVLSIKNFNNQLEIWRLEAEKEMLEDKLQALKDNFRMELRVTEERISALEENIKELKIDKVSKNK